MIMPQRVATVTVQPARAAYRKNHRMPAAQAQTPKTIAPMLTPVRSAEWRAHGNGYDDQLDEQHRDQGANKQEQNEEACQGVGVDLYAE
jgi:hypothetical protein